ncbi:MAG: helix-turn-helix domain-containing protein, partial [Oscillospiraceae bacterium]|nr:helix-turn-helix domain-containing protein [Oscillospiraceae bacterium]
KHSAEWIIARVEEYIDGKGSYSEISRSNGIGKTTLRRWVSKYRARGADGIADPDKDTMLQ